ncbi:DUF2155 domain-containing protein [Litoreibacter albidus]|uniref:DUF2155 domain-containing protein n=1 Tax=Litoreibacter albidus TaxID=670155 RepID=A0A1H2SJY8_9RHOB|nr:DUF2155 domain-containing protein [Litoreibacter albidus]SDW31775.1 hypothetical protein SAMN04488001_0835 [Litoreibacter albidus]
MKRLVTVFMLLAHSANAQTVIEGDNTVISLGNAPTAESRTRASASSAAQAVMRGLDKLAGASEDIILTTGESTDFGALTITMKDCRYPKGNPSGDAFVNLEITDSKTGKSAFEGWMVASSPALHAMDHPRYDVWAIRCKLDDRTPSVVAGESSPLPLMRPEGLGGN